MADFARLGGFVFPVTGNNPPQAQVKFLDPAGRPQVYLCCTFGSDKARVWPDIAPTISGYQSRILVAADGSVRLTEIGEYLEKDSALARSCQVVNTPLLV